MMSDGAAGTPPRVLIVDDNPQILELLEAYLEPLAAEVAVAADGEAALEAIRQQRPDLVLLDIMMPRRSGFEVCRTLKDDKLTRAIPIIMVTALNEVGDMERATEFGADDYISKPVNKIELLGKVQKLLERRPVS